MNSIVNKNDLKRHNSFSFDQVVKRCVSPTLIFSVSLGGTV